MRGRRSTGAARPGSPICRSSQRPAERTTLVRVAPRARARGDARRRRSRSRAPPAAAARPCCPRARRPASSSLDMSASISGPIYARVATTLRGIVAANQAIGLVMFSDTAYELLPPNSPPSALQQFVRFFAPERHARAQPVFGQRPWSQFSGGTRISTGLVDGAERAPRAQVSRTARSCSSATSTTRRTTGRRSSPRRSRCGRRTSRSASCRSFADPRTCALRHALRRERVRRARARSRTRRSGAAADRRRVALGAARARPPARRCCSPANERFNARLATGVAGVKRLRRALGRSSPQSCCSGSPPRSCSCSRSTSAPGRARVTRDDLRFRAHALAPALWRLADDPPGRPGARAARHRRRARVPPRAAALLVQPRSAPTRRRPGGPGRDAGRRRRRSCRRSTTSARDRGGALERGEPARRDRSSRLRRRQPRRRSRRSRRASGVLPAGGLDDPANYDAKLNLELLLRIAQPGKSSSDQDARGGFGFGGGHGVGVSGRRLLMRRLVPDAARRAVRARRGDPARRALARAERADGRGPPPVLARRAAPARARGRRRRARPPAGARRRRGRPAGRRPAQLLGRAGGRAGVLRLRHVALDERADGAGRPTRLARAKREAEAAAPAARRHPRRHRDDDRPRRCPT